MLLNYEGYEIELIIASKTKRECNLSERSWRIERWDDSSESRKIVTSFKTSEGVSFYVCTCGISVC